MKKRKHQPQAEHLYQRIARMLEQQIHRQVFVPGDKLPSLRSLCMQYGISQSTALQVYYFLESKALVESKPQSGYYVSRLPRRTFPLPQVSRPAATYHHMPVEEVIEKVLNNAAPAHMPLSQSSPADELLPIARLNKCLLQATRELADSGTSYGPSQGNETLRRQIARHAFPFTQLGEQDIVTTNGCIHAMACCLMALTQPGDTIAVESPVFFGILRLAQSLHLRVLELPTHPQTGIEMDALKKALARRKIKLCLLIPSFNNPLGSCMPDAHKKELVQLVQHYGIPLVENDIYGPVYFGQQRPRTCKSYDNSGLVLCCGSVSKTLAPGYRVGWVAPGRFTQQVLRQKLFHTIATVNITQQAVAAFLETGRYELHLRRLRHTLYANSLQYIRAIQDYFPEGTRISRPQGGFVLWVELSKKINTVQLYDAAISKGISIAPGRMFTLQQQFDQCMRLNYGVSWNSGVENALKKLGSLAGQML
jgi:DNA-binding transcriptional MocR family regulator